MAVDPKLRNLRNRQNAARRAAVHAKRQLAREASFTIGITTERLSEQIAKAVESSAFNKDVSRKLRNLMDNMERSSRDGREMAGANRKIATAAKAGAMKAYMERVKHGPTYAGSYQSMQGKKYRNPGGMEKALRNPRIAAYSTNSVDLWDRRILDSAASHWYRLNYGAKSTSGQAPRGGFSHAPDRLQIDFTGFTRRGYTQMTGGGFKNKASGGRSGFGKPSEGFYVPHLKRASRFGFGFTQADVGGQFRFWAPGEKPGLRVKFSLPKPTRGIQGRFFLEAGTAAAYKAIGEAYGALPAQWFYKAKQKSR